MTQKHTCILISLIATLSLAACDRANPFTAHFDNIGKDINDTVRYSERMSTHILDKPECAKFKMKLLELGRTATSMNGAFMTSIVETKDAANKAGCSN